MSGDCENKMFYENERYALNRGYSSTHLLSTDRRRYTDERGKQGATHLNEFLSEPNGNWMIKIIPNQTDADGWYYAFSFNQFTHASSGYPKHTKMTFVRRRQYYYAPPSQFFSNIASLHRVKTRFKALLRKINRPLLLHVTSASDLRPAHARTQSSDPYVIVTTTYAQTQQSTWQTQVVDRNTSPTWNESVLIPQINGMSSICLTVVHYNRFSSAEVLGQAMLELKDYPETLQPLQLELLLEDLVYMPHKSNGVAMKLKDTRIGAQGRIRIQLQPFPLATAIVSRFIVKKTTINSCCNFFHCGNQFATPTCTLTALTGKEIFLYKQGNHNAADACSETESIDVNDISLLQDCGRMFQLMDTQENLWQFQPDPDHENSREDTCTQWLKKIALAAHVEVVCVQDEKMNKHEKLSAANPSHEMRDYSHQPHASVGAPTA